MSASGEITAMHIKEVYGSSISNNFSYIMSRIGVKSVPRKFTLPFKNTVRTKNHMVFKVEDCIAVLRESIKDEKRGWVKKARLDWIGRLEKASQIKLKTFFEKTEYSPPVKKTEDKLRKIRVKYKQKSRAKFIKKWNKIILGA